MFVKVAQFRNCVDHLFRVVNVDYHACVRVSEVECWRSVAARSLQEVEAVECNRATDYDRTQRQQCIKAARDRLTQSQAFIEELKRLGRL